MIMMTSSINTSADESESGLKRVLMTRARFAAEGVVTIYQKRFAQGLARPQTGSTWAIGSAQVEVLAAPAPLASGAVTIQADADLARLVETFDGTHVATPPSGGGDDDDD
ncbi:MAG: hypothetical protein HEQ23_01495 [Tepidisphaera sp.]